MSQQGTSDVFPQYLFCAEIKKNMWIPPLIRCCGNIFISPWKAIFWDLRKTISVTWFKWDPEPCVYCWEIIYEALLMSSINDLIFSNSLFYTNLPKILLFMQLFVKILSGTANSVDPDQTLPPGAVWSGSALFACALLTTTLVYEILGHLPYPKLMVSWRNRNLSASDGHPQYV